VCYSCEVAIESPPGAVGSEATSTSEAEFSIGGEPPRRGSPRQVWLGLGLVILVFVALSSFIALKTPAWEAADEPGHVYNIELLVGGHWYGINTHCRFVLGSGVVPRTCRQNEVQQAPLYYLAMAAWQKLVGLPPRPPPSLQTSPTVYFHGEEFAHHSASDHRFLLWLRFPNIALGASTVLVVFLAIRRVSRDPWTPVVAAAILAFLPRFVFLSAFVTNDNLVNFLGAVLGYVALRFITSPSVWTMAFVGATFGLLVATKLSALPMGLVILVLVLLVPTWKRRLSMLAVAGGGAVLTCGWYLIQNTVRYGDPLARTASSRYLALNGGLGTVLAPYRVKDPLHYVFWDVPQTIMRTFWYESGWNQFSWKMPVCVAITVVVLIVLVGIYGQKIPRDVLITLVTLSVAALLSVWIVAFQTASYKGRYALVGCVGIAGLIAFALQRWKLPVRFLLPASGVVGTCIAIQSNVLSVHWT
jgi:Dolichyl-phosphate-mannose-protein mannosyltransferase